MIRFHKPLPPDVHAKVLQKIREVVGEPHAFDERHFLFNKQMPDRRSKHMVELYQTVGYAEGNRGSYSTPIDLEYHQDLTIDLSDGSRHSRASGKWTKHGDV